jgi:DNA-binding XRE family transcriptional regulator
MTESNADVLALKEKAHKLKIRHRMIAHAIGITRETVTLILNGRVTPKIQTIERIKEYIRLQEQGRTKVVAMTESDYENLLVEFPQLPKLLIKYSFNN